MKILTMRNVGKPFIFIWLLFILLGPLMEENETLLLIYFSIFILGLFLLMIAFFIEYKQIKKRQEKRRIDNTGKRLKKAIITSDDNNVLERIENSYNYLYVGNILAIIVSQFFKDTYFGFFIVWGVFFSNGAVFFGMLIRWAGGKKVKKKKFLLSFLFIIFFLIIIYIYYPKQLDDYLRYH